MTVKQERCKDVIAEHWQNRKAEFTVYMNDPEVYENGNDEQAPFHEHGLSFDYVAPGTFPEQLEGYWRYQLSWGGPSDELRFYASSPQDSLYKAEYWFLDWFDGASIDILDDAVTAWLWDFFQEVGSTKTEYDKATE